MAPSEPPWHWHWHWHWCFPNHTPLSLGDQPANIRHRSLCRFRTGSDEVLSTTTRPWKGRPWKALEAWRVPQTHPPRPRNLAPSCHQTAWHSGLPYRAKRLLGHRTPSGLLCNWTQAINGSLLCTPYRTISQALRSVRSMTTNRSTASNLGRHPCSSRARHSWPFIYSDCVKFCQNFKLISSRPAATGRPHSSTFANRSGQCPAYSNEQCNTCSEGSGKQLLPVGTHTRNDGLSIVPATPALSFALMSLSLFFCRSRPAATLLSDVHTQYVFVCVWVGGGVDV